MSGSAPKLPEPPEPEKVEVESEEGSAKAKPKPSGVAPKLFRRESGQIQAVTEDAKDLLEVTKAFVEQVNSNPPPAIKDKLPPGAGVYRGLPKPTSPPKKK